MPPKLFFIFCKTARKGFFFPPDADFVADYIHLDQASLIVKPLVSEAPTQEIEGVSSPRLEKLLVDILCDKDFFYLQGQEAAYIFEKATQIYGIKPISSCDMPLVVMRSRRSSNCLQSKDYDQERMSHG